MHEYPIIIFLAVITFAYGLVSRLSERAPFSAPMVFVIIGALCGPLGFGWINLHLENSLVRVIAEVTLVSILFVEASTIDLRRVIAERDIALRLLFIGLPMTMLLGTFTAAPLFPEMGWWLLALLAFILSPTDAALGQVVVTSKRVPAITRRAIAVESGFNDGLVLLPILMCIAALGLVPGEKATTAYWVNFALAQLLIGPVAGAVVGFGGGRLVDLCAKHRLMDATFQRLAAICLAIMAWALAEQFHGNGYIAAFVGGLLLGVKTHAVRERIQEFAEAEGQQLNLFVFLLFGLSMLPTAVPYWTWQAWVYAVLSLTVLRMLPVVISLIGTPLATRDRYFIGWFGPRGIASVLYLHIVIIELGFEGYEKALSVIVLTIFLSVFLHGMTAQPLSSFYHPQKSRG